MRKVRIVLLLVVLLLTLTVSVQLAGASPPTQYRVHITDATIPWNIPIDSLCFEVPADVVINTDALSSERVKHLTHLQHADGSQHVVITDLVTGTASDNHGISYTFVYQNDINLAYDGSTAQIAMKDTFKLNGGDVNYTAGFNWRWAYETGGLNIVQAIDGNGTLVDVGVDPFFFATNDGANEDPNIVPGSWQQLSTRGDPWNCDPL